MTAGNVKLLLPPRQSRGASLGRLEQEESEGGVTTTRIAGDIGREAIVAGQLVEEPPPKQEAALGESTRSFRASKQGRRPEHETRALGLAGELLVLAHEQRKLAAAGRPDLAKLFVHTAVIEGDGAGFDIASFFPDGRRKYIEVKTTTGAKEVDFFISAKRLRSQVRAP